MPLNIAIVGGGIAGLSAAVALRQAGHAVTVVERSRFAAEVGAALALAPNGARVLAALGFDFAAAATVDLLEWETLDGHDLRRLACVDLRPSKDDGNDDEKEGGTTTHPMRSVYRVDLHRELLRLAFAVDDDNNGSDGGGDDNKMHRAKPVDLKLASPVRYVDATTCMLTFESGSTLAADLIVGADGVHSVARQEIMGNSDKDNREAASSEATMYAFRSLVPTEALAAEEELNSLRERKTQGSSIFIDTNDPTGQRHVVWYGCHGLVGNGSDLLFRGKIQNIVGVHPARADVGENTDFREMLLDEFRHYHPDILKLLSLATEVKCWPLVQHDPLPTWKRGRLILIGDAAHPMLPFGGQAANQALEDAGALGYLFKGIESVHDVPRVLDQFEAVRRKRGSMIQVLSSVLVNRESEVREKLLPFAEEGFIVPSNFKERTDHANSYDLFARCKQIRSSHKNPVEKSG